MADPTREDEDEYLARLDDDVVVAEEEFADGLSDEDSGRSRANLPSF